VPPKNQNLRQADFHASYTRPSRACHLQGDFPGNTLISTEKAARGLLRAGHSISQVAEWTRLPFATLFRLRDGRKKRRYARWHRLTPETIPAIRQAFVDGKDWYQIGEEFGCYWGTVRKYTLDLRQ
jgi:hypothetical protein